MSLVARGAVWLSDLERLSELASRVGLEAPVEETWVELEPGAFQAWIGWRERAATPVVATPAPAARPHARPSLLRRLGGVARSLLGKRALGASAPPPAKRLRRSASVPAALMEQGAPCSDAPVAAALAESCISALRFVSDGSGVGGVPSDVTCFVDVSDGLLSVRAVGHRLAPLSALLAARQAAAGGGLLAARLQVSGPVEGQGRPSLLLQGSIPDA